MRVSAISPQSLSQEWNGVRKAMAQLAATPSPVDSVHVTQEAFRQAQKQVEYALALAAEQVHDQIAAAIDGQ